MSRVGGEEFLILLPGASLEATLRKSDAMRERLEAPQVFHRGHRSPPLTFSAGAAAFPASGQTHEALLRGADTALYEAKHAGRDRTVAASVPAVGLAVG